MTPIKSLINASLVSATSRYTVYVFQLTSLMILSRMLSPDDFGKVASAQVIATFFILLGEMGITSSIIEKNLTGKEINELYSFTFIVGLIVFAALCSSYPLIKKFYAIDQYVVLIIAIASGISCGTAIFIGILQKETKFKQIATYESISEIISTATTIALIKYVEPEVALAQKIMTSNAIKYLLLKKYCAKITGIKFHLTSSMNGAKKIFSFAKYQLFFNVINYFSRNLDNIMIGKSFGAHELGIYDKSYQLMKYPLMLLTFAINPAIQPITKKIRDDKFEFELLHNKFIFLLSIIGSALGIFVYMASSSIVKIILGNNWIEVVPLLEILSITIPIQVNLSSSGGFFQGAGRPDVMLKSGIFSAVTNSTAIIYGIQAGNSKYVCWSIVISFSINLLYTYYLMGTKIMPSGPKKIFANLTPMFITTSVLSFFVYKGQ